MKNKNSLVVVFVVFIVFVVAIFAANKKIQSELNAVQREETPLLQEPFIKKTKSQLKQKQSKDYIMQENPFAPDVKERVFSQPVKVRKIQKIYEVPLDDPILVQ
ncbi:hypothetical protein MNBD_BACTEROID05-234 [hydrothermal vent metagenome]|uniref:Uncharacterized protein n=1 Tax=hydrothermal vent metagenome TaxID=652676 RepID=A0A3B0TW75_9ZZZZ